MHLKNIIKRAAIFSMAAVLGVTGVTSVVTNIEIKAAGKTVEAFENNPYGGDGQSETSDAKQMYKGIKKYDSDYKGIFKEGKEIKASNFYSKSRTIKYWAGEGNEYGELWGKIDRDLYDINIFKDKDNFSWSGSKLEFVFLAVCNQLNKEGKNPVKKYAKAMLGDKAVRVICGYHDNAPGPGDDEIVKKFLKFAKTGESVKSSWIKANEAADDEKIVNAKNYAVLTHDGNAQYSRFPGFSSKTYTRPGSSSKKIIRFRRGVEDGEKIVKTSNLKKKSLENKIPNYRLEAKPVKVVAKKNCEDIVFNEETQIITDGGEIKATEVEMSKKDLYQVSKDYFDTNLKAKNGNVTLERSDMTVAPILVSDACTDEEEQTVAYSVHFSNNYEGIPIEGEGYNAIIDNQGVKYTATEWNTYQKEEIETEMLSLDEAVEVLQEEIEEDTEVHTMNLNNNTQKKNSIKSVSVSFVYNETSGYYEPSYHFELTDDSVKDISCIDGTVLGGDADE